MTEDSEPTPSRIDDPFAAPKDVSGLTHIPWRVFLLALLIVLVNSWVSAHLGVDLRALLMIEGIAGLIAILSKPLGKDDAKTIERTLRRGVELLLGTRFLGTAFAIFLLCGSLVSSVTLLAGGVQGIGKVDFCADDQSRDQCSSDDLKRNDGTLRFIRLTNPLGRPFHIDAAGFRRHSFQLYPWIPTVIRASTDLQRSPSILFRVDYPHLDIVGGQIRIVDEKTGTVLASASTDAESAALLLGSEIAIPESLAERWDRQLAAAECPDAARPAPLERWFNPAHVAPSSVLAPGQRINAYFLDRGQLSEPENQKKITRFAAAAMGVTVGTSPLQDVRLKRRK